MSNAESALLRDLTEEELRSSGRLKWAVSPDVLPAWVAEMDFAVPEMVLDAVRDGLIAQSCGYPAPQPQLADALCGYASQAWGWDILPEQVVVTHDVLASLAIALRGLADPGPVVVTSPSYPPFLHIPPEVGREVVTVVSPTQPGVEPSIPLDGIEAALRAGGRTVILCNPHNPLGRAWRYDELVAFRDVVEPYDALVIADEIHAPLTLPGVRHIPYATVASPGARHVSLVAATKVFNISGIPCAQLIARPEDVAAVAQEPAGASVLAQKASIAAYRSMEPWRTTLTTRLAENHLLFRMEMASALPDAWVVPAEATYLAWVHAGAYAAGGNLAERAERVGRVKVGSGFGPGSEDCVRVNLATSPERVMEVVRRLRRAWT